MDFFLNDPNGVRVPGYSTPRPHSSSTANQSLIASPTISHTSTVSTTGKHSEIFSRKSSVSSITSVTQVPPWHRLPDLNQQLAMPLTYNYTLPCEFQFIGCNICSHPEDYEAWVSHSLSHFGHCKPPPYSICVFCDENTACFRADIDPISTWRDRMVHIGTHLADGLTRDNMRPDYWLINYMRDNALMSRADFESTNRYTERPSCDGLVPLGYETEEMKRKKERKLRVHDDLQQEERRRRRTHEKNKSTGKPSSRRSRH